MFLNLVSGSLCSTLFSYIYHLFPGIASVCVGIVVQLNISPSVVFCRGKSLGRRSLGLYVLISNMPWSVGNNRGVHLVCYILSILPGMSLFSMCVVGIVCRNSPGPSSIPHMLYGPFLA